MRTDSFGIVYATCGTRILECTVVARQVHAEVTLHVTPSTAAPVTLLWVRKVRLWASECGYHPTYGLAVNDLVEVERLHKSVHCLAIKIRVARQIIEETRDHLNVSLDTNVWLVFVDDDVEHLCFTVPGSNTKNTFS